MTSATDPAGAAARAPARTVTLVAAGAGTGKTHRLVEEVERALVDRAAPIEPEAIVAVTYTRAAAAELDERLRRRLIAHGRVDLARRLGAARIGTVHAVCQRLVEAFAFELGLSPDLRTLDEPVAEHTLSQILSDVLTGDEINVQEDLARRMPEMRSFTQRIKELVDKARAYGMSPDTLRASRDKSRARMMALLPEVKDGDAIEEALMTALTSYLKKAKAVEDPDDRFARNRDQADRAQQALAEGRDLAWRDWLSLSLIHPLRDAAAAHVHHPLLRDDMVRAHDLVYDVAARGLERYAQRKRAWGVVDFVDQEMHALRLLDLPQVRERLREEIALVLVDEMQDTSPQQLRIFRRLAEIAPRSIWVGDRKQSIYGFRGADPSLVDEALARDVTHEPPALDVSYRSRAPLVALTSAVFQNAFAKHDARIGNAQLRAHADADDPQLGAYLEWWDLDDARMDDEDAYERGIARGIVSLLKDENAHVRDPKTGEIRRVRAGDIAVLVRRNARARGIASQIEDVGVRAATGRHGLASTTEARVLAAGLRLWIDGGDALAAAEIVRVLSAPEDPDAVMRGIVPPTPADETGANVPATARAVFEDARVRAVVAAAREHGNRALGVVGAVDRVVEALGMLAWCARVPLPEERRANLAALRALAIRTVASRETLGRGTTVATFLARLDELRTAWFASDDDDLQGLVHVDDAVHVGTWHGAKGLEWPVVILAELAHKNVPSVFGLHVERADAPSVDAGPRDEERWLRDWVTPYTVRQASLQDRGLFDVLRTTPEAERIAREATAEELRVLYVAWTRARDRLVLACAETAFLSGKGGPLKLLDIAAPSIKTRWHGVEVKAAQRRIPDEVMPPAERAQAEDYVARAAPAFVPASIQPSAAEAVGSVAGHVTIGGVVVPQRPPTEDEAVWLGSALHALYAADHTARDAMERHALARDLLRRYRVDEVLGVAEALTTADRLWAHVEHACGTGAQRLREQPIAHRLASGTMVRGYVDLIIAPIGAAQDGVVVIDHKTYVADVATSLEKARTFAGQLRTYRAALEAAGTRVRATWIHMPLAGLMIDVT